MCEPWPILWPCDTAPTAEPAVIEAAVHHAESFLWAVTGRRLGVCTVTERYRLPGSNVCGMPYKDAVDGYWRNGGRQGRVCCELHLANRPVRRIVEVKVLGGVVSPASYALERRGRLRRVGSCWPSVDPCDEPPVEVTYEWGVRIAPAPDAPEDAPKPRLYWSVASAMGEVASEMVKALCGEQCKLPATAVTVVRSGVTHQYPDPTEMLNLGRTGLPLTDALIRITNPTGDKWGPSRVYSPDFARRA